MLTIPQSNFTPYCPPNVSWIRGQMERGTATGGTGDGTGYLHWQLLVAFTSKKSLVSVREVFGPWHAELSRSEAASDYVWKEETSIPGTRFELGTKPVRLNSKTDWETVWINAQQGQLELIPPFVRVKSYRTLRAIGADFARPRGMVRTCRYFWGPTGTGKSHRAWEEAGPDAYPKSARSKFWDGYRGQENVVLDEFRGAIDIGYLLTWLDRYPVSVEIKGSSMPLQATRFWICSNLRPEMLYPGLDEFTLEALLRRLEVIEMNEPFAQ